MVEMEEVGVVLLILAAIVVVFLSMFEIADLATGRVFLISEPIKDLQPGQLYEVLGVAKDGEDCYLLLKAKSDNVIRFYRLPSNQVPPDLKVGDGLIKLPTGLQRIPQEFLPK